MPARRRRTSSGCTALNALAGHGVSITPREDLAMVAVQGPNAREKFWRAFDETKPATEALAPFHAARMGDDIMVARTGYTGEDGFEVMLPRGGGRVDLAARRRPGVRPCGLGARDTLRLEAGMNLYGQDMDAATSPLDAGLAWTVDLKSPRHFFGRKALESRPRKARFPRPRAPRQGRRAARAPEGAGRGRRRRDHQRHLFADARRVDRARAPADGHRPRRPRSASRFATRNSPRRS